MLGKSQVGGSIVIIIETSLSSVQDYSERFYTTTSGSTLQEEHLLDLTSDGEFRELYTTEQGVVLQIRWWINKCHQLPGASQIS